MTPEFNVVGKLVVYCSINEVKIFINGICKAETMLAKQNY